MALGGAGVQVQSTEVGEDTMTGDGRLELLRTVDDREREKGRDGPHKLRPQKGSPTRLRTHVTQHWRSRARAHKQTLNLHVFGQISI